MPPPFTEGLHPVTRPFRRHDTFAVSLLRHRFIRLRVFRQGPRELHRIRFDDLSQSRTRGSVQPQQGRNPPVGGDRRPFKQLFIGLHSVGSRRLHLESSAQTEWMYKGDCSAARSHGHGYLDPWMNRLSPWGCIPLTGGATLADPARRQSEITSSGALQRRDALV
jgi:hypothetical protein